MAERRIFIQNDGMCLDYIGREAWFVDRNKNILYRLNLDDRELQYELNLNSDKENPYRRTPLCYKKGQIVVLFPDRGEKILFYDVKQKVLEEHVVKTESDARIGAYCFGEYKDLLWAVSYGRKQLFLIDVELKRVVKLYKLFAVDEHIEMGYESILCGGSVFCVSRNSNYVSRTDLKKGQEKIYELPVKENGFNTIFFDGEFFWLSSMSGNIYLWDSDHNTMELIYSLKTTMYRSIRVGDVICFLPFNLKGNLSDELCCCKIKDKRYFSYAITGQQKEGIYVFEYVKDNRFIGISHSDIDFIIEIDVENGDRNSVYMNACEKYWKGRRIDEAKIYVQDGNILYENDECSLDFYLEVMQKI